MESKPLVIGIYAEINPSKSKRFLMAVNQLAMSHDFEPEAYLGLAKLVRELNPEGLPAMAISGLVPVLVREGEYSAALELIDSTKNTDKYPGRTQVEGIIAYLQNEYSEARRLLRSITEPITETLEFTVSSAAKSGASFEEVREHAMQMDIHTPLVQRTLAHVLFHEGNSKRAYAVLNEGTEFMDVSEDELYHKDTQELKEGNLSSEMPLLVPNDAYVAIGHQFLHDVATKRCRE